VTRRKRLAAEPPSAGSGCDPSTDPVRGNAPKRLRVGSDFSGIGTFFIAAEKICKTVTRYKAVASHCCDNTRACKKFLLHNHAPERFDNDITKRDTPTMPACDAYQFTAPCKSFSPCGSRAGVDDKHGDGALLFHSLAYIRLHKPPVVTAENSPLLASKFKAAADVLVNAIESAGYIVQVAILNTASYGIPQRRKRWYLLGIRSDICRQNRCGVAWFPPELTYSIKLSDIIRPLPRAQWQAYPPASGTKMSLLWHQNVVHAYTECCKKGVDPFKVPVVIDMGASKGYAYHAVNVAPTLTRNRSSSFGFWCSTKGGPLDVRDLLLLQGFEETDINYKGAGLSDQQIAGCLGNAQSLNVVTRVLAHGLFLAKYITKDELSLVVR